MGALGGLGWLALLGACGGPSESRCAAESEWNGNCTLKSVTKLREAEFPVPHVVMEAVFEPQQNPSSPNFTPPAIRQEFKVMANQEQELRGWLEKNSASQCQMAAPPPGSCQPGPTRVALPEFRATGATAAGEIHGCAKIESSATQDQLPSLQQAAAAMPDVFAFAESSAEATPDVAKAAGSAARRIAEDPGIECVAVVGQVSPGEPPGLAAERARKVRELLVGAGVDGARLTTISVAQAVFGSGTAAPPPDPNKRRVTLKVLLRKAAGP